MESLLEAPLDDLLAAARKRRRGAGLVTYSPKVFIPLTMLCRDVCGYCTFARPPRRGERAYLTEAEVLGDRARRRGGRVHRGALHARRQAGAALQEVAREELAALGCETTPRVPGPGREAGAGGDRAAPASEPRCDEAAPSSSRCRPVSASMGIMLETLSERLLAKGGPHWASPDKEPARRLETIDGARRPRDSVHERHPDRDRRDAGGADRGARWPCARCTSGTAASRR